MANAGSANDGELTVQHDLVILKLVVSVAILASNDVAEIADVTDLRVGTTMGLVVRVVVGAGGLAALNQVT